jgi:phosphatidate cytidylyltransferase
MGTVLVALTVLALVADRAPAYPILFALVEFLALVSCFELLRLLPPGRRPARWLCYVAVFLVIAANWWPAFAAGGAPLPTLWVFAATVIAAFLVEMASFREPGESLGRIALAVLLVAYLGVLPSFLVRLRWQGSTESSASVNPGVIGLALAIFVPKCCDIGAYFTGRLLGRHRMAPVLSPKKTWEGAAGGLAVAVAAAIGIDRLSPVLANVGSEIGFGLSVGVAGMLGDLAESLIKRDVRQKDASQAVPGFGGVLDVVDAILFAAPVAYLWLRTDGLPLNPR